MSGPEWVALIGSLALGGYFLWLRKRPKREFAYAALAVGVGCVLAKLLYRG
jgi:hypothetical protein